MKNFSQIVTECLDHITEVFPWDLAEELNSNDDIMLLDVREWSEFEAMHIKNSLHVPRGVLESACDFGYEETVPELAKAHDRNIVVICRSGNRSALAVQTMQMMGYQKVRSLKTGLRGWNDDEQALQDICGNAVDIDFAEEYFTPNLREDQIKP